MKIYPQEVDLDDVAVHQVGRKLGFVDEKLDPLAVRREAVVDDLDRHPLREAGGAELLRLEHGRHPAAGDLAEEAEAGFGSQVALGIHAGAGIT